MSRRTLYWSAPGIALVAVLAAGCGGSAPVTPSGKLVDASAQIDAASGEAAHPDLSHDHEHPDPATFKNAAEWKRSLLPVFEQAANEYSVPLDLLLVLGKLGSGFENRGDVPTIEGGYGAMALRDNALTGDSLVLAAGTLGVTIDDLVRDPALNILGAAAALDLYATKANVDRAAGLEAWLPAVVSYAGLDAEDSRFFAVSVYELLQVGFDYTNSNGESFSVAARPVFLDLDSLVPPGVTRLTLQDLANGVDPDALAQQNKAAAQARAAGGVDPRTLATPDYPGATWDPAASCNYTATVTTKDTIVVHTIEGSAAGARSWFKNCSAQVSAHYVVSEAGGVWQMVEERYRAWHVGCYNNRAVGIEHEGYAASSSHPATLYNASGLLARNICDRRGIAKQKTTVGPGIIGHVDVTNCCCGTHTDPGNGWDWSYYIAQVVGAPALNSAYNAQSYTATMQAGSTAVVWVEYRNTGTSTWNRTGTNPVYLGTWNPQDRSSAFYTAGNWIGPNRPTDMDVASCAPNAICRFSFVMTAPSTPGVYTEYWRLVKEGVAWFGFDGVWFQVTVTVPAPTITSQPSAVAICSGGNANFTVGASGSGLSYQWQKNGANIANGGKYSGVTTTTLTVTGATSAEAGNYRCVVSNAGGSATSNDAALTIKAATTITTHPTSQTVCPGSNVTFTGAATGDGTVSYQWQKDGVNISGATAATLQLTGVGAGNVGSYRVVATAGCGSATSNAASLALASAPVIAGADPVSLIVEKNTTCGAANQVNLSATGFGTLTWSIATAATNGTASFVGGTTGASATVCYTPNLDQINADSFVVRVTDSCGATDTVTINVSVDPCPNLLNDAFGGYASQAAFESVWVDTLNSPYYIDTTNGWVYMPSPSANSMGRYYRNLGGDFNGTDANPLTLSFSFYLDAAGAPNWSGARHYVELRGYSGNSYNNGTLENLLAIGVNNNSSDTFSTTRYQGRVVNGSNWQSLDEGSAPVRQSGWHTLKIEVTTSQVKFYVDNVLSETEARPNALGFDCVVIGADLTSNGYAAAVDNLTVTCGP